MSTKIKLRTNENGEWEQLLWNGELIAEDHEIRNHDWIKLLREFLKIEVEEETVECCPECGGELIDEKDGMCGDCYEYNADLNEMDN